MLAAVLCLLAAVCVLIIFFCTGSLKPDVSYVIHHIQRRAEIAETAETVLGMAGDEETGRDVAAYNWYSDLSEALTDLSILEQTADAGLAAYCVSKPYFTRIETDQEVLLIYCPQDYDDYDASIAAIKGWNAVFLAVKLKKQDDRFSQPAAAYTRGISLAQMMYSYDWEDTVCEYMCREYLTGMYAAGSTEDIYYGFVPAEKTQGRVTSSQKAWGTILGKPVVAEDGMRLTYGSESFQFWQVTAAELTDKLHSTMSQDYTYAEIINGLDIKAAH